MGNTFYLPFEPVLMQWLQNLLGEGGSKLISHLSFFGEVPVMVLIFGLLYWCFDKEFGIYVGTNAVIGLILNPMIKNVALRRRPYMDHEGIMCYRPVEAGADIYDISAQGYSFPSGHAMNSTVIYGSIGRYLKNKVIMIMTIVLPILVGISRIVVGVHYPTDIFVGWIVGLIVIFLVPALYSKFGKEKRWLLNLILFLLAATGFFYCRTIDYFTGIGAMGGFFAGIEFEERFVKFENVKKPYEVFLRMIGGLVVYFCVNTLVKLPFSKEFLSSPTMGAYTVRSVRYFIVLFFLSGVYPLVFRFFAEKKKANKNN